MADTTFLVPLYPREAIARRVRELAQALSSSFAGREPIVIGVLKGAFVFVADLVRELEIPVTVDFLQVASYGLATESSGAERLVKDLTLNITGQDVILVDTIVDTGLTWRFLRDPLLPRHPRSLTTCVLIDKRQDRREGLALDHVRLLLPEDSAIRYR